MVIVMRNFVLYASSCLSCYIVMTILLEFMNERYQRSFKNKYLYPAVKLGFTVVIAGVNMMNVAIFNFLIWIVAVAVCAYWLYYEDVDKPVKRLLECEILICIIAVCETLGGCDGRWDSGGAGYRNSVRYDDELSGSGVLESDFDIFILYGCRRIAAKKRDSRAAFAVPS